jgi:hypothetical protein
VDHTENDVSNNSSIVVFVAMVIFLLSPCLAKVEGYTYRHTLIGGFMMYAVEMSSGAMIYKPSFINKCSGIENFFQNKESRLNWDGL